MEGVVTVNINIGLGKDNPVLTINPGDNLSAKVDRLISDYQLPRKVHSIIMRNVEDQLPQINPQPQKTKEQFNRTPLAKKNTSVSPNRMSNLSTIRPMLKKATGRQKENNQNASNWASQTMKNVYKRQKSVSPNKLVSHNTTVRKIQIKSSKSPIKYDPNAHKQRKSTISQSATPKIIKLFRHLTKSNPKNIKIMSPEFIDFRGLDKNLLNQLQLFFQSLQQHEFDLMNEQYFAKKVEELDFKDRLIKKQYDYCYMN